MTRNNPMTNIYTIETNSTRAEHSCENVSTRKSGTLLSPILEESPMDTENNESKALHQQH